jgi:DNA integrity scanning protein DisA with diadenylate cyclase activity
MILQRADAPDRDRQVGPVSKMVGLYQMFLRRSLEHFFPDALLEVIGDRSFIDWDQGSYAQRFRIEDDPDGLGVILEWFRTRYLFQPVSPSPFLSSERRLIETALRALEMRFRGLFDPEIAHRLDRFHYLLEDLVVTDFLDAEEPYRIPAALEALRVAALSTYENRRVSTGALLLGTDHDPAAPGRVNPEGAPRFNTRLTAIKGFHRLCDGVRTLFLVDRQGEMSRAVDIHHWAEVTQGTEPLAHPCPRDYWSHAKATRSGGHVCVVLTPSQEIKVFARGVLAFAFSDARWRLLDIPTKFAVWCEAVSSSCRQGDLARRIFQAALNLSEDRKGALFVVLRDPAASIEHLIAPADRIDSEVASDDPQDPENLSPRLAKRSLHHVVRGQDLLDLDPTVLEAIAGLDGAVVTDLDARLLTFGAILRIGPETQKVARAVEGARTLAALAASYHGPVLKVSEDGFLTMYLGGRRVWEL